MVKKHYLILLNLILFSSCIYGQSSGLPKGPLSVLGIEWGSSLTLGDGILRGRGMEYVVTQGTPPWRTYHGGRIGEYDIFLSMFSFSESKGFYKAVLVLDTGGVPFQTFKKFLSDLTNKYGKSIDTSFGTIKLHTWVTSKPLVKIDFSFDISDQSIILQYTTQFSIGKPQNNSKTFIKMTTDFISIEFA